MRIGIDYTAAVHQHAGIGRYTRGIVGALADLGAEHSFVLVVAGKERIGGAADHDEAPVRWADNFETKQLPLSRRFWTIAWHRLRLPLPVDLLTGRVDVFHSPDYVLPPLRRGKKVVTVHDLSFLRFPEGAEPSLRVYLCAAVPRAVRQADLVLADSESTRQDLIELLAVDASRVEVVYPGVGEAFRVEEDRETLRRTRDLYELHFPFILSVGTLEPRKNLVTLLDAFAALRGRNVLDHKLVIAGRKGWLYESILRRVEQLGLEDDVVFLGYVAEDRLPAVYCLADALVFPSVYEGFGLPPLEAMACGTPVIASDSSSLPEVLGDAGLMVPTHDHEALAKAIERVLEDAALRESLISRGLSRATEFTWQRAGKRLLDIYRSLGEDNPG